MNYNKIQDNDLMAMIHFVKVRKSNLTHQEILTEDVDCPDNNMRVQGKELLSRLLSADRYEQEKKVNKTKLAKILTNSYNKPFTVNFQKADDSLRTLRGRLLNTESLMGRSLVEDLDIPLDQDRTRSVDHRTLQWLIVDNVLYYI